MSILSFPLYHATSSLFLDSIKEYGLGGVDPVKNFRVIELLIKLEIIADKKISNSTEWQYSKNIVSRFTLKNKMYEHGQVYLTPCLMQARSYALNIYGSEAFSETFKLIELLDREKVEIPFVIIDEFKSFFSLRSVNCEPIIFRLHDLSKDYILCNEDGSQDVDKTISLIESKIKKYGFEKYDP